VKTKANPPKRRNRKSENGILNARPSARPIVVRRGIHRLGISPGRDGVVLVPETYRPTTAAPLIVVLHGAGRNGHDAIQPLRLIAEERGIVLVAPDSRHKSWDAVTHGFGPDVDFIDLALASTFERCSVDPSRLAIAGFSDGASYCLALGLANGDLFTHIIAFSPGFIPKPPRRGRPKIFVSHGSNDVVLPSARCSQRIVSGLEGDGYEVCFREFTGDHLVPAEISRAATDWFLS
jgi:phospholipase/carboxylesterase